MPNDKENLLATVAVVTKLVKENATTKRLRKQIDARRRLEDNLQTKSVGGETEPEDET